MTEIALIGANCEASGHPSACEEPAAGVIEKHDSHNITVTVGGTTKEVATPANSNLSFDSHAHSYTDIDDDGSSECTDMQSHTIDGSGEPSVTINGSPVYLVEDGVASDPGSGGTVDITSNPIQSERDKV